MALVLGLHVQQFPFAIGGLFVVLLFFTWSLRFSFFSCLAAGGALYTLSSRQGAAPYTHAAPVVVNKKKKEDEKKDLKASLELQLQQQQQQQQQQQSSTTGSPDSSASFQQKREQLHKLHSKSPPTNTNNAYGGKELRKDFKRSTGMVYLDNDDPKEKEHRAKVAQELLNTERQYVEKLQVLVEIFEKPMQEANVLTNEQLVHIFSNIGIIRNFNVVLLKDLERIVSNWSSHSILSGIFLQMADFLKLYTTFINNYTKSMQTLTACKKQNAAFAAILEKAEANPRCDSLNLPSLLIMPVQRIPRYILLLTEIQKHTPKNNPDLDQLTKSLAKVKEVADDINEACREAEALARIYELTTILDGLDDPQSLISPTRRLLLEGELKERPNGTSLGNAKIRYYFLFNDLLLCTKQKGKNFKFLWQAKLKLISLVPEVNNEFGLSMAERIVILSGASPEETHKWEDAIATQINDKSKRKL